MTGWIQENFRLQLPPREIGRIRLARFELTRPASATHVARRAKLLGALTGLSKRQRDRFGRPRARLFVVCWISLVAFILSGCFNR